LGLVVRGVIDNLLLYLVNESYEQKLN
jgi:hypothetical protein